ncbi:MAG: response regulator [Calditrichae bacterium]|nr:response regulator [Calditrichota bacterium]MCB9058144.1 response regulator [Calditrichia bacterium]
MKILIVDDTALNARIMSNILSEYAECHVVQSGFAAIDKVEESFTTQELYDIIFMDIMMPEMDGIQCVEKIREFEKNNGIKASIIYMVTALKEDAYVKRSLRAGCNGYILKPVEKYSLISQLRKAGFSVTKR